MLETAILTRIQSHRPDAARTLAAQDAQGQFGRRIVDTLKLIDEQLAPQRRLVHAGEAVYRAGDPFDCLLVLHAGFVKLINMSRDGREQVVGLKFRGDWLGFDGIATGAYSCDAVAMDTGEVWLIPYSSLIGAFGDHPSLLTTVHEAMSREIAHDRDSLMSVCTLPADARVADFLRYWAESLAKRGMRSDLVTLRMSRADIGNYLGMTLESVSRALSRLAKCKIIAFADTTRREVRIPDVMALSAFVEQSLAPPSTLLQ